MSTNRLLRDMADELAEQRFARRQLLKMMAMGGAATLAGGLLSGCGGGGTGVGGSANIDVNVLNFALNLEYLEAEYYLRATTGAGLSPADAGAGAGAVTGGSAVPFVTSAFQQYAQEIAADELAHVRFLKSALGNAAAPRPVINLQSSFDAAASAAGIGPTFNPFENEINFLLGAYIFEDVGVTAYKGAAAVIKSKTVLEAAAGILGVEAYHAGAVRTVLYSLGGPVITLAQQISDLRDSADGAGDLDQGIELAGQANIVPTDVNGIAYSRTTAQVLSIVYLGGAAGVGGGFYPNGLNGAIR